MQSKSADAIMPQHQKNLKKYYCILHKENAVLSVIHFKSFPKQWKEFFLQMFPVKYWLGKALF